MARVNLRGFRALDRRTVAARSAIEFRSALLMDLGGEDLSAARMALVESATRTWLYVQHLDAWLLEQKTLVNARRKAALPILRDRQALSESLTRLLQALGLERVAPRQKDLAEIIREIEQAKAQKAATPTKAVSPVTRDLAASGAQDATAPTQPATVGQAAPVSRVIQAPREPDLGYPVAEPVTVAPPSLRPDPAHPVAPLEVALEVPEF